MKRLQESGQRFTHLRANVRTLQGKRDVGLKEADAVAAIVSGTLEAQAVERLRSDQARHAVRKLNFISRAAFLPVEMAEQFGLTDDQVRRIEREGLDNEWPPL